MKYTDNELKEMIRKELKIMKEDIKERKLDEGINDKNIFKAVFLAGGPGSGKSTISNMLFGMEKGMFLSPFGLKVINSDLIFEKRLQNHKLSRILDPKNADEYSKQMQVRAMAKELTATRASSFINGMLPLLIDGTGKDYQKIVKQANALSELGYDVSMIFVNTSRDVALERNRKRERSLPDDQVIAFWNAVQDNIAKFNSFFGSNNFFLIDNTSDLAPGSEGAKSFTNRIFKMGSSLMNRPLKNPLGLLTIELLNEIEGKMLSDMELAPRISFNV